MEVRGMFFRTAWPAAAHDPDLERFGIIDYLECRVYSCELGWEKPAPQIFHAALDCMGLQPDEAVFVGDFLRYEVGVKAVRLVGADGRFHDVDNLYDWLRRVFAYLDMRGVKPATVREILAAVKR